MTIRAELRCLHSPDADPLENYRPHGPFGLLVMALVGPQGACGEESFAFTLCTPEWFTSKNLPRPTSLAIGRHFIFVQKFDYAMLEKFVRDYCAACEGETWQDVATKLGRLGHWEFEDYNAGKPPLPSGAA
jgi:Immunity protein 8